MDPLSIISGTLAVVGAAVKASQWVEQGWDLRHREQDFQLLWNQAKSLRLVLWSMQIALKQVNSGHLGAGSGHDCLENIAAACDQAVGLFEQLSQELQEVRPIRKPGASDAEEKPTKRKWVRRKTRLTQLATQTTTITTSLTSALVTLRNVQASITADEVATRIESLLQKVISDQTTLVKKSLAVGLGQDDDGEEVQEDNAQELGALSEPNIGQVEESSKQDVLEEFVSAPSSPVVDASGAQEDLATIAPIYALRPITLATISEKPNVCKSFCRCQCHAMARMQTPQWAALLLGQMVYYGNCSIFLNRRACNMKRCRRSGATNMQLIYDTPAWASKLFKVYIRGERLQGFAISLPRVISNASHIWRIVQDGNVPELRRWLWQRLASPYDMDDDGESLLMYAAEVQQHEAYSCLLSEKADPYFRDIYGVMAYQPGLDALILDGTRASTYNTLYRRSEHLDAQDFSLLHLITLGLNSVDLVVALNNDLDDVDITDSNGRTPLWWAAWTGNLPALSMLLSYCADVDKADHAGDTPLIRAATAGHVECVQQLLQSRASVNLKNKFGMSPMHRASYDRDSGNFIIQALLEEGADVHARHVQQFTPLHWAASRGSTATIELLLKSGANIDAFDEDGVTPAELAICDGNGANFMHLVNSGAQLVLSRNIHNATWYGSPAVWDFIAEIVLEGKVDAMSTLGLHDGHDIFHCFRECRNSRYLWKREADEFSAFQRMISAIELRWSMSEMTEEEGEEEGKEEEEIVEVEQA